LNGKKKKGQEEFEDTKMVIRFVNRRKTDNGATSDAGTAYPLENLSSLTVICGVRVARS
jgi:hypothetical protein